jgi:hypothetical protein
VTVPDYDPLTTPFEMPIAILVAYCQLERPLMLPPRKGATLATTIRGAYGTALEEMGQQWLHRPHSAFQRRDHASPIVLRFAVDGHNTYSSETLVINDGFELSVLLLGRKAVAKTLTAIEALERTGKRGLTSEHIQFFPTIEPLYSGTLYQWIEAQRQVNLSKSDVLLTLDSPMNADTSDLSELLGTVAHDLVQWDLEDSGRAQRFMAEGHDPKRTCDALADYARAAAAAALEGVAITSSLSHRNLGKRQSATNPGAVSLHGDEGWICLSGDLEAAIPWLRVLELRGGGKKKSFGLGSVRIEFVDNRRASSSSHC